MALDVTCKKQLDATKLPARQPPLRGAWRTLRRPFGSKTGGSAAVGSTGACSFGGKPFNAKRGLTLSKRTSNDLTDAAELFSKEAFPAVAPSSVPPRLRRPRPIAARQTPLAANIAALSSANVASFSSAYDIPGALGDVRPGSRSSVRPASRNDVRPGSRNDVRAATPKNGLDVPNVAVGGRAYQRLKLFPPQRPGGQAPELLDCGAAHTGLRCVPWHGLDCAEDHAMRPDVKQPLQIETAVEDEEVAAWRISWPSDGVWGKTRKIPKWDFCRVTGPWANRMRSGSVMNYRQFGPDGPLWTLDAGC